MKHLKVQLRLRLLLLKRTFKPLNNSIHVKFVTSTGLYIFPAAIIMLSPGKTFDSVSKNNYPDSIYPQISTAPAPKIVQAADFKAPQTLPEIQPVPGTVPTQTAVTAPQNASGCVTGYTTGNPDIDYMIGHESGGDSCITNAGGCFGLLQACPGAPLEAACGGDPACQIAWFAANKLGAYNGSWAVAYDHEITYGWW